MSAGQPEEDEISSGSDELPIENTGSRDSKIHFHFTLNKKISGGHSSTKPLIAELASHLVD